MNTNSQLGWKTCFTIATSSIALMTPVSAQAQSTPDRESSSAAEASSGDIIVTARRREESLSKVPIAVAALSADALTKQGIRSETDLQAAVPGFLARETGNAAVLNLSIRGQSIDGFSGSPPAVLPYVNEFQISTSGGNSFFDLDGVQVLKGPQGTLFGRNTTGGAVLYATKKPGNNFEGYVTARYGNFNAGGVEGGVTVPIVQDRLSIRIAGHYSDGGGFMRNLGYYSTDGGFGLSSFTFNPDNSTLGDVRSRSIRATILANPTDAIENTFMVQRDADDGTVAPSLVYSRAACNASNSAACTSAPFNYDFGAIPFTNAGPFQTATPLDSNIVWQRGTVRDTYSSASNQYYNRGVLVVNTTKIDLGSDLVLKNIVGWNHRDRNYSISYSGSAFDIYRNARFYQTNPNSRGAQHGTDNIFSDELQLQGKAFADKLDFIAGLYYANVHRHEDNTQDFYGVTVAPFKFATRNRSYAAFAQVTYNITDQLHFTAGGRYGRDKIDAHQLPNGAFSAPGYGGASPALAATFLQNQEMSFENPSWNVSLDYRVTPDLMIYVTQRGSWRAGGYNFPALPRDQDGTGLVTANNPLGLVGNIFGAEKARDVEVGAKFNGSIGGMQVTINADVYNQWISNVQRTVYAVVAPNTPGLVTINVPKAQVTGAELGLTVRANSWLTLGGQITHTNPRYTDGKVFAAGRLTPFTQYADVPKWSGAAFFEASYPLADDSSVTLRGDVYAQSKYNFANYKPVGGGDTEIPGYALVNGRIGWNNIMGSKVSASAWVKNLFDKQYYAGGLSTETSFGTNTVAAGRPRSYGAELTVKF